MSGAPQKVQKIMTQPIVSLALPERVWPLPKRCESQERYERVRVGAVVRRRSSDSRQCLATHFARRLERPFAVVADFAAVCLAEPDLQVSAKQGKDPDHAVREHRHAD